MPNTTSTSTTTTTTTITTITTSETTKMTNTRITISCSASGTDDDELTCKFGDPRVKVDRGVWLLEVDENESVVLVLQDSGDNDVTYALTAKSSQDGGSWSDWRVTKQGVESPLLTGPTQIEIEVQATVPGQTRAKKSTSSGSITLNGRPDPTLGS